MTANLEHYRHQVHQFGSDILQVEAFLDFMIGSVEAAYNTNTNKIQIQIKIQVQNFHVEAFLDFSIGSVEAAYNTNTNTNTDKDTSTEL